MTGLLLIAMLLIWIAACAWLVRKVGNLLPDRPWRAAVKFALFVTLLPLPLIDEIIAKPQFEALCREKAILVLDTNQTRGRTIWYEPLIRSAIRVGSLEAELQRLNAVEVSSGELVYHYHTITVTGGWLMQTLKISETTSPLVMPSSCAPKELHDLDIWRDRLGITHISRPISNQGQSK